MSKYKLSIRKHQPTGRYYFEGAVPAHLMFETKDGHPVTEDMVGKQMSVPLELRSIRARSFHTRSEAELAHADTLALPKALTKTFESVREAVMDGDKDKALELIDGLVGMLRRMG
jgi:hypothetical protein